MSADQAPPVLRTPSSSRARSRRLGVVVINRGDRPVYVQVLGLGAADGEAGFDDRRARDVREVQPGGQVSLVVDEEMVDWDVHAGVRGFAELATDPPRIYSDRIVPTPVVDT